MTATLRRGACPAIATPMATGDGLLARLVPAGALTLDAFAGLCASARAHGNGVIEVTSRGSLQFRGLTAASTPQFAGAVEALDIDAVDSVPIAANPLTGRDPLEMIQAGPLAAKLRAVLVATSIRPAPKTSVVIDGGGALHLDMLAADVRLRADERGRWHVAVGGDAAQATALGAVAPSHAVETVMRLLYLLASQAPSARARDVIATGGAERFRAGIAEYLMDAPALPPRPPAEPLAIHALHDGRIALGIGLPFGHSDAETLMQLMNAARDAGADGIRPAPGRALLLLGIAAAAGAELAAAAGRLGFIVDPGDPSRRVVACAGSPICSSAQIPARKLAPAIAAVMGEHPGIVHLSGCAKGCAHRGSAAVTIMGRDDHCDLFVRGKAAGIVPVKTLIQDIARLVASERA